MNCKKICDNNTNQDIRKTCITIKILKVIQARNSQNNNYIKENIVINNSQCFSRQIFKNKIIPAHNKYKLQSYTLKYRPVYIDNSQYVLSMNTKATHSNNNDY